jgi:hypothetical protein
MTQKDFISIAGYLKTAYPNSNFLPTQEAIKNWFEELKDLEAETCKNAMREYVRNNDFPPSIAGIRRSCVKKENILADTWDVAWDKVMVAVRKYGTYGAREAMESLDPLTRKSIKAIGFYEVCTSSNTNSLRREFRDIYEQNKHDYDFVIQSQDNSIGIEDKGGGIQ